MGWPRCSGDLFDDNSTGNGTSTKYKGCFSTSFMCICMRYILGLCISTHLQWNVMFVVARGDNSGGEAIPRLLRIPGFF
ncbi:hypothetical protein MKW98_028383 [Papaver atlanticum]|uniref:Uncharacterized protein n=1 Tax=Papaver atlanticum TaxID=357466 RepID=A0AAD4XMI0_9MAGN|nr:hypothetical protein MKW98_028383 [Papaver atlanticum]